MNDNVRQLLYSNHVLKWIFNLEELKNKKNNNRINLLCFFLGDDLIWKGRSTLIINILKNYATVNWFPFRMINHCQCLINETHFSLRDWNSDVSPASSRCSSETYSGHLPDRVQKSTVDACLIRVQKSTVDAYLIEFRLLITDCRERRQPWQASCMAAAVERRLHGL